MPEEVIGPPVRPVPESTLDTLPGLLFSFASGIVPLAMSVPFTWPFLRSTERTWLFLMSPDSTVLAPGSAYAAPLIAKQNSAHVADHVGADVRACPVAHGETSLSGPDAYLCLRGAVST